jgi:hypothetical protein
VFEGRMFLNIKELKTKNQKNIDPTLGRPTMKKSYIFGRNFVYQ